MPQFFGKPFWTVLAGLCATFLVSIVAYAIPALAPAVLALAGILTFALALRTPEYGLAIAFAELFANSHGHLVSADVGGFSVSLRMVVFAAVMSAWAFRVVAGRSSLPIRDRRLVWFVPLFVAVLIGAAVGVIQNDARIAFADGNAYFYLAYLLPILSVDWDASKRRLLLQAFAAATAWVVILTLGLLYVFTHFPEWTLGPTYRFIRDTRTGELTKMAGNIFRVFLQAQFSAMVALYLAAPFLFRRSVSVRQRRVLTLAFAALVSVALISLSRSFWVGIVAGDVALLLLLAYDGWPAKPAFLRAVASVAIASGLATALLVGIVLFPFPYRVGRVGDLAGLFSERTTDLSDVAISSRWNLLPPLMEEIRSAPLLGSGFGEEVTFKTDDPRARAINPDGTWTTYALEWGWLDLWLKMGILGPVAFAVLLVGMVRGLLPYLRTEKSWVGIALISALVMLYATHVFSPYLNHPLGLGLLLLAVPFLKQKPPTEGSKVASIEEVRFPTGLQASVAPSISE